MAGAPHPGGHGCPAARSRPGHAGKRAAVAFDPDLAQRLRAVLAAAGQAPAEMKMFGGLSFLVRDNMFGRARDRPRARGSPVHGDHRRHPPGSIRGLAEYMPGISARWACRRVQWDPEPSRHRRRIEPASRQRCANGRTLRHRPADLTAPKAGQPGAAEFRGADAAARSGLSALLSRTDGAFAIAGTGLCPPVRTSPPDVTRWGQRAVLDQARAWLRRVKEIGLGYFPQWDISNQLRGMACLVSNWVRRTARSRGCGCCLAKTARGSRYRSRPPGPS